MTATQPDMRLTHEEQAKIRFANRVMNIYTGRSRLNMRHDAEDVIADIGDALCAEGLMV